MSIEQKSIKVTVYHGTDVVLQNFKDITYFSTDIDSAKGYARGKAKGRKKNIGFVYEVELILENPIYLEHLYQIATLDTKTIKNFKLQGFDSAIFLGNENYPFPEYVPFNTENIMIKDFVQLDIELPPRKRKFKK